MSDSKAMIVGASSTSLTSEERRFFNGEAPWGFILFARNLTEAHQISDLVEEMKDCVGRPDAPIFIDQEGGRVQRIRPPLAASYPPGRVLGALYDRDHEAGLRAAWIMSRLHAFDLQRFGINADCLPVLDVPIEGAHDVIGDRAYAKDPEIVASIGQKAADGLIAGGVMPVIKHIPGHGRAASDSHYELPVVNVEREVLEDTDFLPFVEMRNAPAAMTAHVVYAAIDPDNPATTSSRMIGDIIRGHIGFDGLLMSDDVSMKALAGDFAKRTKALFSAGCDVALHCNGVMEEMRAVAKETRALEGTPLARARRAVAMFGKADNANEADLRQEFSELVEAVS